MAVDTSPPDPVHAVLPHTSISLRPWAKVTAADVARYREEYAHSIDRERLTEYFWPEQTPEEAAQMREFLIMLGVARWMFDTGVLQRVV